MQLCAIKEDVHGNERQCFHLAQQLHTLWVCTGNKQRGEGGEHPAFNPVLTLTLNKLLVPLNRKNGKLEKSEHMPSVFAFFPFPSSF